MATINRSWDDYTSNVSRDCDNWATSDRGWFLIGEVCYGHYLDYGPDHYRSGHEWCRNGRCDCPQSQPGNVHAVRFDRTDRGTSTNHESRYFPTVAEAKSWIEAAPWLVKAGAA